MKDFSKYQGIFPAFYACYDKAGQVSGEASRALARYLLDKGEIGRASCRERVCQYV